MLQQVKTVFTLILLFLSALLGSIFFLFPFVPLLILIWRPCGNRIRYLIDRIVGFWLSLPVALVQLVLGVDVKVFGECLLQERSLIIMNHRTRLDWLFLWNALYTMNPRLLLSEKIILKAVLKRIVGAGWAMMMNGFVFIERKWEEDKEVLNEAVDYYSYVNYPYQILLFPEGTDLCSNTLKRSDSYAETRNLTKYKHVLHPRTTGFVHMVQKMRKENYLDSIFDVTIAYPKTVAQTEKQFASGVVPEAIQFEVKRFDSSTLPASDDQMQKWCEDRWEAKESRLQRFFCNNSSFDSGSVAAQTVAQTDFLWFSLSFWISFVVFSLYLLLVSHFVQLYVIVAVSVFILVERMYGGLERFQFYQPKTL